MKKEKDAFALAEEMVQLGKNAGRNTAAVVSDMDQPLGYAVGNALEVREAIETLKGKGPKDFTELCLTLGSYMLLMGGKARTEDEGREMLKRAISSGEALSKLAQFVKAQGGSEKMVYEPALLPKAKRQEPVLAEEEGYVEKIVCDEVGICSLMLGGGRETKESVIDLSVGIVLEKKVGDKVNAGDVLAWLHANDSEKLKAAKERLLSAYTIGKNKKDGGKVIIGVVK